MRTRGQRLRDRIAAQESGVEYHSPPDSEVSETQFTPCDSVEPSRSVGPVSPVVNGACSSGNSAPPLSPVDSVLTVPIMAAISASSLGMEDELFDGFKGEGVDDAHIQKVRFPTEG